MLRGPVCLKYTQGKSKIPQHPNKSWNLGGVTVEAYVEYRHSMHIDALYLISET